MIFPAASAGSLGQPDQITLWPELVSPERRPLVAVTLIGVYGVGLVGGAMWGGLKGLLAGWLAASAVKSAIGAVIYSRQEAPTYAHHSMMVGALSVVEAGIAAWLGSKVLRERRAARKSAWSVS